MMPTYVPVLKAMKSEAEALGHVPDMLARKILPLFEVSRIGKSITNAKRFEGCITLREAYLDEVSNRIATVWHGRLAMVDAYQWSPDTTVESGEHFISYIYSKLESMGVHVVPVIGYDRWDNDAYRLAMQALVVPSDRHYCLRFDTNAIEDAMEPEFFQENVMKILDDLQLEPSKCFVMIDFADVSNIAIDSMMSSVSSITSQLDSYGFRGFITTGCSLPPTINIAVKMPDSTGSVLRREMMVWQAMRKSMPSVNLVYGDYGVRGPSTNEGNPSPHTNGKIRYTIDQQYFIARGHSMQLEGKGAQMYTLSEIIIKSPHYMRENFSWGDKRILECSQEGFKGTAGQWIAIDTSHHLAYVLAEVEEFERRSMKVRIGVSAS